MPCINDMDNIKKYLKNVGITQKEFAERIKSQLLKNNNKLQTSH